MNSRCTEKKEENVWYCTECGTKHTYGKYCTECGTIRYDLRNTIHAERDSVCMGDDCAASHAAELKYKKDDLLSDFMPVIADYVPSMKNVRWVIICSESTLGCLYSDDSGKYRYSLEAANMKVSDLAEKEIFCRYEY